MEKENWNVGGGVLGRTFVGRINKDSTSVRKLRHSNRVQKAWGLRNGNRERKKLQEGNN